MSRRSLRMKKALESLGWQTEDYFGSRNCNKCGAWAPGEESKFCHCCGTKLPPVKLAGERTRDQLERCIAYALGESKKLPGAE